MLASYSGLDSSGTDGWLRVLCGRFEGKLEGDPFHSSGFITAFSHLTVQQQGAFTLTARTFSGDLAELERTLADLDIDAAV